MLSPPASRTRSKINMEDNHGHVEGVGLATTTPPTPITSLPSSTIPGSTTLFYQLPAPIPTQSVPSSLSQTTTTPIPPTTAPPASPATSSVTAPSSSVNTTSRLPLRPPTITPYAGRDPSDSLMSNIRCETWLQQIQLRGAAYSDLDKIQMAYSSCVGRADEKLSSPLLNGIVSWPEFANICRSLFKEPLPTKVIFEYFDNLKMKPNQTPYDFLSDIQDILMRCTNELPPGHPPGPLMEITFKAGLPDWLKQSVGRVMDTAPFNVFLETVTESYRICKSQHNMKMLSTNPFLFPPPTPAPIPGSHSTWFDLPPRPGAPANFPSQDPYVNSVLVPALPPSRQDVREDQSPYEVSRNLWCHGCKARGHIDDFCPFRRQR